MQDCLFYAFPCLAPSDHLNIKAMFAFVERIHKPDIQADDNEQRVFSMFKLNFFTNISHLANATKINLKIIKILNVKITCCSDLLHTIIMKTSMTGFRYFFFKQYQFIDFDGSTFCSYCKA